MYQDFLLWLNTRLGFEEGVVKQIKAILPIGEFSRLMKENGLTMTRRSTGMVYLKTALKFPNAVEDHKKHEAMHEKEHPSGKKAKQMVDVDEVVGYTGDTNWGSALDLGIGKTPVSTKEELLARFEKRSNEIVLS
jgi:hypothetical protein